MLRHDDTIEEVHVNVNGFVMNNIKTCKNLSAMLAIKMNLVQLRSCARDISQIDPQHITLCGNASKSEVANELYSSASTSLISQHTLNPGPLLLSLVPRPTSQLRMDTSVA